MPSLSQSTEAPITNFTSPNYLQDAARTVAEQKLAFEQNLQATKELLGGLPIATITMSGTSITPPPGSAFLSVATPGGASSANLNNCVPTIIKDGAWLALRMANAGQVVVVKHGAGGAGQFALVGSADLSLADPTVILLLALSGSVWTEVGRFYGTQGTAFRNFYALAGLGQNRFTGRQEFNRGAAITAATTLAIGTDGNYFLVTGTTPISGIAAAPPGTRITLQFASAGCTLVHTPGALVLSSGGNYVTNASDVLEFISDSPGAWRQLAAPGGQRLLYANSSVQVVQNTTVETQLVAIPIPGNTLIASRRLRLTIAGYWNFGVVQLFGVPTVYGTQFRLGFGASIVATAYIAGGYWAGSGLGYIHGQGISNGMTIEAILSANGSGIQIGHLTIQTRAGLGLGVPAGWNGPAAALKDFGIPLGQQLNDINGVPAPGRGQVTEDAVSAKTLSFFVMHNYPAMENYFVLEHQALELLA